MAIVDQQLSKNDCGISAVKTVFNIFGQNISRDYIQDSIALDEKGARIGDLKDFFENHGFKASYKLLDINHANEDLSYYKKIFPFILPIVKKDELHYVVINDIKGKKFRVLDSAQGNIEYLTFKDLSKIAHFSNNFIKLVDIEDKIHFLINQDLNEHNIDKVAALSKNTITELYNKLNYFTYFKENYGFQNIEKQKKFLTDIIFFHKISFVPKQFRLLQLEKEKVRIKSPLALTIYNSNHHINSETTNTETKNVFVRLVQELGQEKKLWYIYIFATLIAASVTQLAVFINQILIDNILPSFQWNLLVIFAIGVSLFKLFDIVISLYKKFVSIHLGNYLDRYFLNTFDDKLNTFSVGYIDSYKKGDLIERLSDSLKLKAFFLRFFTKILVDVIISLYSLLILLLIDWKLTLVVTVVMVIYISWFKIITPYLKKNERERFISKADLFSKIIEKIDGNQVIRAFRLEHILSRGVNLKIDQLIKIQTKLRYIDLFNSLTVSFVTTFASILILFLLAKNAIEYQSISIGQIITFIMLSGKVFSSLSGILKENLMLQEHEVILRRYFDFREKSQLIVKKSSNIRKIIFNSLNLKNVNFEYFKGEPVLEGISFNIKKGEKVQIIGRNGSGKSTLCKVLTSIRKPTSGHITLNEIDISYYSSSKLRQKILLVTNEDLLFNETIEFNITLGRNISASRIMQVAKMIDFYDFVDSKEDKLDYLIYEKGKNLSTGQRKKILLMRALLSKSEVIILDEVLSGIDEISRKKIENTLSYLKEKALIIISHEPIKEMVFNKKYKLLDGKLYLLE